MHGVRVVLRRSVTQWDTVRKCKCLSTSARCLSAEALPKPDADSTPKSSAPKIQAIPKPDADSTPKSYAPKIQNIVNEISSLTLLEVSELSQLLKKRLNLPDAPVMPVGGFAPMAAPAAAQEEEKTETVKDSYSVKLVRYHENKKIAVIKEIKNLMEGMNLVQAKKFVESVPVLMKENVDKKEAEKIKEDLHKVGAIVELE